MKRSSARGLRVVRPVWWVVALLLATLAVWERYAVVRLGADVEKLQGEIAELSRARDRLLVETANLSSRDRIEAIATGRLGLRPTTSDQIRTLPSGGQGSTGTSRGMPAGVPVPQ
jgi:cell division protein FtsL